MFIVAAPSSVRQGGNFTQMKTEKAIRVLRDYASLSGKLASDIYAACPYDIRMAIEDLVAAVYDTEGESERELKRLLDEEREAHTKTANELYKKEAKLDEERKEGEEQARLLGMSAEREAKLIAERDLWKAEAEKWRQIAIDLDGHTDEAIKRLKWRQDSLERGIKELKG